MRSSDEESVRSMSKRILRYMLKCFPANIEVHGYGKDAIQGAHQVIDKLRRYVDVMIIKTDKMLGEKYIQILLRRRDNIYDHFNAFKERANGAANWQKFMKRTQMVEQEGRKKSQMHEKGDKDEEEDEDPEVEIGEFTKALQIERWADLRAKLREQGVIRINNN